MSSITNYRESNYYYYYSQLEINGEQVRSRVGLRPMKPEQPMASKFKMTDFLVNAEITDSCSVSVIEQVYKNNYEHSVEAIYRIPLPSYSAVSDFWVEIDGNMLKGKIKETEIAKENYDDAIASGNQAFLAVQNDDGFFELSLGNIQPGNTVKVLITITSELGAHLEDFHYCLHQYLFPSGKFNFNLNLKITLSTGIESVILDQLVGDVKVDGRVATLSYSSPEGVHQNILTVIQPKLSDKPDHFIEYIPSESTYAVALNFYPKLETPSEDVNQKFEFIFVLDCSGSMSGSSIQSAKQALEILIRSLTINCKFNIILFGSSYQLFKPNSIMYNDESLETASKFINGISANLGGTDLYPPILYALSQPFDPEYPRQVFILTDGSISDREQLIQYVSKESNSTRIFTFGIGGGVDKNLVVGLSRVCKGYYSLIKNNNNMDEQVMSLMNIAMEPAISNIKINWTDQLTPLTIQAPQIIRPIYNRERMIVYGLIEAKEKINETITITLTGNGPTGVPFSIPIALDLNNSNSNSKQIHTLAAHQIINLQSSATSSSISKEKIIQLGKRYGLVSKHTSYFIEHESTGTITGDTMQKVVIQKSSGRHSHSSSKSKKMFRMRTKKSKTSSSSIDRCSEKAKNETESFSVELKRKQSPPSNSYENTVVDSSNNNSLLTIIKRQTASGCWNYTSLPFKAPPTPSELKSFVNIWATIVVIAKLIKEFSSQSTQWEQVSKKAVKYVKSQLTIEKITISYEDLLEIAKKSI
eukprot:gene2375-2937_t